MKSFTNFTQAEKKHIRAFIDEFTVPSTDFEIAVINKITGIDKKANEWRFEKGVICSNCNRHLTILDYFLNGILHHPIEFIQNEVCPDYAKQKECHHHVDPKAIDKIDVVDNEMPITCCNCGTTNHSIMYKLYLHPGCKGSILRMSSFHYQYMQEKFMKGGKKSKA